MSSMNLINSCLWNANGKLFCIDDTNINQNEKNKSTNIITEKFVDESPKTKQIDILNEYWHKRILYVFIGVMSLLLVLMLLSMFSEKNTQPAYNYSSGYGYTTHY